MKIKVPQKTRSGLLVYKVVLNNILHWEEGSEGLCNHRTKQIDIDPCSPFIDETFLHEKLEQINRAYALKMEHDLINTLSFAFAEFLWHDLGIEFDWSEIDHCIKEG